MKRRIILSDSSSDHDDVVVLGQQDSSDKEVSMSQSGSIEDFVVNDEDQMCFESVSYSVESCSDSESSSGSSSCEEEQKDNLDINMKIHISRMVIIGGDKCYVCGCDVPEETWHHDTLRRWAFSSSNAKKCSTLCNVCSYWFVLSPYDITLIDSKGKRKRKPQCTGTHTVFSSSERKEIDYVFDNNSGFWTAMLEEQHECPMESLITNTVEEIMISREANNTNAFQLCKEKLTIRHLVAARIYGCVTPWRGAYCVFCCNQVHNNKGSDFGVDECTKCGIITDAFCHPFGVCNRCFRSTRLC